MKPRFSFWIHWLFLIAISSRTLATPLPGVLAGAKIPNGTLAFEATHPGNNDNLFTKPSSGAQEFLLQEKRQNKQSNPLVRIEGLLVQQRQQKYRAWCSQHNSSLPIFFFFKRKIGPPSPTDDPFLS